MGADGDTYHAAHFLSNTEFQVACATLAGGAGVWLRLLEGYEWGRQHIERGQGACLASRSRRLAAISELERNSQRLLELAGAGAGAGAEGCLRALEEQLRSARELSTRQRTEIDSLREHCDKLHAEWCRVRESRRVLSARLSEAEREAAEMQDFLAAETGALGDSLRDAEAEIEKLASELERRYAEHFQVL
nr:uncharacterized protein LOC116766405 [Danaus plexippus plexippus]